MNYTHKLMMATSVAAALFSSGLMSTVSVHASAPTAIVATERRAKHQVLTVPHDLNRRVKTYLRTGRYTGGNRDTAACNRNNYQNSAVDEVPFNPAAPMSTADRNYFNLYAIDLINQVRQQNGLRPLHATVLGRNFAHQISNSYTAENHPYGHDPAMIQRVSDRMHANWTGENISDSFMYKFTKDWAIQYPIGYTRNLFKQHIYDAINEMFLQDAHENYGHAVNFLSNRAYSYGFSYRFHKRQDIILNFDGEATRSAIISADGTVRKAVKATHHKKAAKKSSKKSSRKVSKKSSRKVSKKSHKKSSKKSRRR